MEDWCIMYEAHHDMTWRVHYRAKLDTKRNKVAFNANLIITNNGDQDIDAKKWSFVSSLTQTKSRRRSTMAGRAMALEGRDSSSSTPTATTVGSGWKFTLPMPLKVCKHTSVTLPIIDQNEADLQAVSKFTIPTPTRHSSVRKHQMAADFEYRFRLAGQPTVLPAGDVEVLTPSYEKVGNFHVDKIVIGKESESSWTILRGDKDDLVTADVHTSYAMEHGVVSIEGVFKLVNMRSDPVDVMVVMPLHGVPATVDSYTVTGSEHHDFDPSLSELTVHVHLRPQTDTTITTTVEFRPSHNFRVDLDEWY